MYRAEDLGIVMPMHNLLEYSDNYSIISGSLWNYFRDEITGDANENDAARTKINNNRTITRKFFEYKTKLTGTKQNNKNTLDTEFVVPLKYWSNFLIYLDLLLINCETEIDLAWSKACIISEISITAAIVGNPRARPLIQAREARQTTGATFHMINAKLYVPVVTLSIDDNMKLLENINPGF